MRPLVLLAAATIATPVAVASRTPATRAAAAPCTTPTAPCERWVTLGGGPARSMVYATHPLDARSTTVTRAVSLPQPTADDRTLLAAATQAMDAAIVEGAPIRLLGISFSGLVGFHQPMLDDDQAPDDSPAADEPNGPQLPAPLRAADIHPGIDVHVVGQGDGWVVAYQDEQLTVRIEGPATAAGVDRQVTLGSAEILLIHPPAVHPLPQRSVSACAPGRSISRARPSVG
jgi:DNA polymerase-4